MAEIPSRNPNFNRSDYKLSRPLDIASFLAAIPPFRRVGSLLARGIEYLAQKRADVLYDNRSGAVITPQIRRWQETSTLARSIMDAVTSTRRHRKK